MLTEIFMVQGVIGRNEIALKIGKNFFTSPCHNKLCLSLSGLINQSSSPSSDGDNSLHC